MPKSPSDGSVLRVLRLPVGEMQANCFLLWRTDGPEPRACLIVDPGGEADRIAREMKQRKLAPEAILITHCHCDHIGALAEVKHLFPAAAIHAPEAEASWMGRPTLNLSYFFGGAYKAPAPDRTVQPDQGLALLGLLVRAIHVPGHSPGGMAYFVRDPGGGAPRLFCGDILFETGIGRGDLPGGEGEDVLIANIRERLFVLPDETIVHAGHGEDTTLGREKAHNPYCGLQR